MMLLVHGVLQCNVVSSWVTIYLPACTHTGLPVSVSAILHPSGVWSCGKYFPCIWYTADISNQLPFGKCNKQKKKKWNEHSWTPKGGSLALTFNEIEFLRLQWEISEKWVSRCSKHLQRAHLIENSWDLMGENPIKLVEINIDLVC